jgi:hypothetical protein
MIGAVVPVSVPRTGPRCDYRIKLPKDPTFEGWRCTAAVGPDGKHDGDHGYSIVAEEEWERAAAPATPSGDDCRECGRQLNVEEPAYRAPGGDGWRCAQCEIADVHTPTGERRGVRQPNGLFVGHYEAPTLTPLGNIRDMRTSELMRFAATELQRGAIPGGARDFADLIAGVLRDRAGALARWASRYADGDDEGAKGDVLRGIGEVRS